MTTEIMSFFEKNPLTTPVGQRIASATDASLASENWALNMEICDLINDTEDGPKDGIKAIRKRLQQNAGKNYTVVMYTLTVLETCVKNCGKRFHILACSKDFVSELVKLIGPKNDPPTVVQEKVLSLIQSWADAFRHQGEMSGVVAVYSELRQKGIEFPMTDLDTMAPIITPQRSVTDSVPPPVAHPVTASPPRTSSPQAMAAVEIGAAIPQNMTPEQLAKLRSEMDIVKTNMSVLSSMLSEVVPGKEHPSDLTLLQELHATCRAMQRRLVDLVGKLAHDQMTAELLHINDEMNNLFLRYSRYEKNRDVTRTGGQPAAGAEAAASLIDLSEDAGAAAAASSLAGLAIGGGALSQLSQIPSVQAQQGAESAADSEFDKLAQARNVTLDTSKKSGSTYQDNLQPDQSSTTLGEMAQARSQLHRESDFDEIEAWLGEKEQTGTEAVESLTSSEFERFLAERAAAAESLPPATTSASTRTTTSQSRNTRELDKDDKENSLFAL